MGEGLPLALLLRYVSCCRTLVCSTNSRSILPSHEVCLLAAAILPQVLLPAHAAARALAQVAQLERALQERDLQLAQVRA